MSELIGKDRPTPAVMNQPFDRFICALNGRISAVHRVKFLYFPLPLLGNKEPLFGLQMKARIYISTNCNKDLAIQTLIHELAHFVFELSGYKRDEKKVLKIEQRLWQRFSEKQKETLWLYIPTIITLETTDKEPLG